MANARPLNEQYEEAQSQYASIQPSAGGISRISKVKVDLRNPHERRGGIKGRVKETKRKAKRKAGVGAQATGMAMRGTGTAMQAGGKATKAAGTGVTAAGVALSATGVGAVVGVPVAVFGRMIGAAGSGVDAAGKATRKAGKKISKKGRALKRANTTVRDRLKVTRINVMIWAWNIFLWLTFQIIFGVLNLLFFGVSYVFLGISSKLEEIRDGDTLLGTVVNVTFGLIEKAFESVNAGVAYFTGIDIAAALEALNPVNFFMATWTMLFAFGAIMLFFAGLRYVLAGFNPLGGSGAGLKISAFIVCLIGYSMPLYNMFPWILLWTGAVWLKPK